MQTGFDLGLCWWCLGGPWRPALCLGRVTCTHSGSGRVWPVGGSVGDQRLEERGAQYLPTGFSPVGLWLGPGCSSPPEITVLSGRLSHRVAALAGSWSWSWSCPSLSSLGTYGFPLCWSLGTSLSLLSPRALPSPL